MEKEINKPHSFECKERSECYMHGIEKVVSSSESTILLLSSRGAMEINGKKLKIIKFDISDGTLSFEGDIDVIKYNAAKVPLLKRLFK